MPILTPEDAILAARNYLTTQGIIDTLDPPPSRDAVALDMGFFWHVTFPFFSSDEIGGVPQIDVDKGSPDPSHPLITGVFLDQ
jgi:hypothetical protein